MLWVFAANAPAQRFYGAHGWRHDEGALVRWTIAGEELTEWRFSRALTS